MKKSLFFSVLLLTASTTIFAQSKFGQTVKHVFEGDKFNHLDFGATINTTGVGFDLAMPVGNYMQIRTGATFMPKFEKDMHFNVEVGESGTPEEKASRFAKMQDYMRDFTGLEVSNMVDMIGETNMNNFKFLVDVYPFKNKHWHVTAGFYIGGTNIGKAKNSTASMSALLATTIYNNMYKNAAAREPLVAGIGHVEDMEQKVYHYGMMTIPIGEVNTAVIAQDNIFYDYEMYDRAYGEAGKAKMLHPKYSTNVDYYKKQILPIYFKDIDIEGKSDAEILALGQEMAIRYHKGDPIYSPGDTYRMLPDEESMVKADAKVNAFKPYLGFGYSTNIGSCTTVSFDAGLLFWGGKPSVIVRTPVGINNQGNLCYAEVDMCRDLNNIRGRANDYVKLFNKFWAYPTIGLRISQRIF